MSFSYQIVFVFFFFFTIKPQESPMVTSSSNIVWHMECCQANECTGVGDGNLKHIPTRSWSVQSSHSVSVWRWLSPRKLIWTTNVTCVPGQSLSNWTLQSVLTTAVDRACSLQRWTVCAHYSGGQRVLSVDSRALESCSLFSSEIVSQVVQVGFKLSSGVLEWLPHSILHT